MKRVHVWKRQQDYKAWSWCGREIEDDDPKGPDNISPFARRLDGATCIDCVKRVLDATLWRLNDDGQTAHQASRLLDSLRHKKQRSGKKRPAPEAPTDER